MSNDGAPQSGTAMLVERANQLAEGQGSAEEFQQLLQQRIQQSGFNRAHVEKLAEKRGQAFIDTHAELLDQTLALMEAYEEGLLKQAEFFDTEDPQSLRDGSAVLLEHADELRITLRKFGETQLSFGPSDFPVMNTTRNILAAVIEGEAPPQLLSQAVSQSVKYYEKAIEEIDNSEVASLEPYQLKKKTFQDLIRALGELEVPQKLEDIDAALRPLQLGLEAKLAADEKIFLEHTAIKPTSMPAANVTINILKSWALDIHPLDEALEALNWYEQYMTGLEEQFDLAMEGDTDSQVIQEELPRTRELIDLHQELLEHLKESLEDESKSEVESCLDELADVINRLEASSEIYNKAAEREGKTLCVKCGHPNPPGRPSCESCGFKLPHLVDPSSYGNSTFEIASDIQNSPDDDYHMGVNTLRLFEAAYHYYEGEIDEEAFMAEIKASRQRVEQSERDYHSIQATYQGVEDPEGLELFQSTSDLFAEGAEEWLEGLDCFEEYIDTGHRPTIEKGIHLIFVASVKIQKVVAVGDVLEAAMSQGEVPTGGLESSEDESGSEESPEHVITYEESYQPGDSGA